MILPAFKHLVDQFVERLDQVVTFIATRGGRKNLVIGDIFR
jgi:hypothetical protein